MEDQPMTSYHLVNFLAERGFNQNIDREFRIGILDFLPYLLERSVWERILETPPDLVKLTSRDSVYEELVCGMTLDKSLFMALAIQEAQKDDAQPGGSADKSELPIQQSSASMPSHGTTGQDAEGDAELEQHSTCTSSARKRPADETSPLSRPKHKRKKRHCRDTEDDMMQSDAELGAIEQQMTTEVNQEFDTDHTTDTTTYEDGKPVHVSKRRHWTPEEDKTIKSYFKSEKTQQHIAAEVHQESDIDRTQRPSTSQVKGDQVRERIEELGLVKKAAPYTEAEQAMIILGAQLGKSASEIAAEVNKEFHNDRTTNAISTQRKILMGPDFESRHPTWSPSELSHLRTIVSSGEHIPTAVKSWLEQTGSKRTLDAAVARLKLTAAETTVPWTDEEDAALMTACEGLDKTRLMTEAFKSATETKRTDKDIILRIEYLGLNLGHGPNPECENHSSSPFQGSHKPWTSKEEEFLETLRDGYNDESRYQAWKKEFGPTRTLMSLKTRLVRLSKNPRGKLHRWTLDEDNYLRSYPDLSKGKKLAKMLALTWEEAFGHTQTANAIQHRLYPLSDASRSMERCSRWSPSEDAWLLTVTKEEVGKKDWQSVHMAFVDKFGMGRTANALRARRVYLRQAAAEAKAKTSGSLDKETEER
ncbi:hypothetical protein TsFJ059_006418 [Trichoderma semiorbis]|uniref:Myb-like domain-containing protein n=1 Tax=Trichoderma semiorbis TaxID=1491008 RepID=A0A9P8KNK3_9HYPO|nr:hypothetical protein TsFJ059_006418 [Trichoderma semiorbis]